MTTIEFFSTEWVWSPVGATCVAAGLLAYFFAFGWNRRAPWALASAGVVLFTLMSPLAALAQGYLFSAHMLQHILLLLGAPALALLALPSGTRLPGRVSMHPALCWACGVAAMWAWHAPALCNAAAASRAVSAAQTVSLLTMGGAFWWQLLAPRDCDRIAPLRGVAYLFAACIACSVLGIILTFAPVTVCRAYASPVDILGIEPLLQGTWGMNALRDQQIGGLIMWVPMCLVYLCAIFGQLARWYSAPAAPTQPTPANA